MSVNSGLPQGSEESAQAAAVSPPPRRSSWLWLAFTACALVTIGWFFIPAFIIRPFAYQAPRALVVAMALRYRAPIGTTLAALLCLALACLLWQRVRWMGKTVLVVSLIPVLFSAVMARLNYFEWMFHPVPSPQFEAASQSKLDASEMVLAVRLNGDDRAYPISQMAYHHLVNDVVGGVPLVATY